MGKKLTTRSFFEKIWPNNLNRRSSARVADESGTRKLSSGSRNLSSLIPRGVNTKKISRIVMNPRILDPSEVRGQRSQVVRPTQRSPNKQRVEKDPEEPLNTEVKPRGQPRIPAATGCRTRACARRPSRAPSETTSPPPPLPVLALPFSVKYPSQRFPRGQDGLQR